MQSILKELWYGNVTPGENRILTKTEKELANHVANHYDYLTASLAGKAKRSLRNMKTVIPNCEILKKRKHLYMHFNWAQELLLRL